MEPQEVSIGLPEISIGLHPHSRALRLVRIDPLVRGRPRMIFIILATILYPNKYCRSYVEAGEKWQKCPKLSSKAKNGRT